MFETLADFSVSVLFNYRKLFESTLLFCIVWMQEKLR